MKQTTPFFCGKDCGGNACPLLATVENGRVTRVVNNPAGGKYLKGCTRGFDLPLAQNAPDRILAPLIRSGPRGSGSFREASWDEALGLTVDRLGEIRSQYGPSAILKMGSAGDTGALHCTYNLLSRFLGLFGGYTCLTSNYSNGAARFVLPYLLGDQVSNSGFDAATMQYSQMIILWGANILETRMGTEIPQRLVEARQRGAQIVVIDPRRSATVKHTATQWLACRPGTDAALMLAVLQVLLDENLADRAFIDAHSVGFDALETYIRNAAITPQWAESICGIPAHQIVQFARAYAAARPAMLLPGYSIQRSSGGEETYRLAVALQIATGNFGLRGGSTGSLNNCLPNPRVGGLPAVKIPEQPGLPVVRWPDAILNGKQGGYPTDIHAVYSIGGNFLNQGSDLKKNQTAFEKVDFAVSHEIFLTPTARYCDVIFPAATAFEKEDIGIPWLGNYLLYRPQALAPAGQARSDYDIFCALAQRFGFYAEFSQGRTAADWIEEFIRQSEIPDPQVFRQTGIYLAADQERVGLADFSADPAAYPLSTPSGKVEIASQRYQRDTGFPAYPTWQPPEQDSRFPLRLITPKSPHFTHSQGSNLPALRKKAAHALEIHPTDAAARGIQEGDLVELYNLQGTARMTVRISADLVRGVVCLHEGIWADLDCQGIDRAGSANLFTSTQGTRASTANIMHAIEVEVKKADPIYWLF